MKRRTTLALAIGALLIATAAAIPVLDLDHPDARDLASWIEVDDPPAHLLEPVPTAEGLVIPDLEPRTPPEPRTPLYGPCDGRAALALALTVVPEAPPAVPEPEAPPLAGTTVTIVLELSPPAPAPVVGAGRVSAGSCPRSAGVGRV